MKIARSHRKSILKHNFLCDGEFCTVGIRGVRNRNIRVKTKLMTSRETTDCDSRE